MTVPDAVMTWVMAAAVCLLFFTIIESGRF